jgi:hypothetical protein
MTTPTHQEYLDKKFIVDIYRLARLEGVSQEYAVAAIKEQFDRHLQAERKTPNDIND